MKSLDQQIHLAGGMEVAPAPIHKLSVLMPVYNERWTLREIVGRVLAAPIDIEIELIIVDDASTDGSWEEIENLAAADQRIRIFRHPKNRGKGAAIRTGIPHITGEVAIIQDADLEYNPQEYPVLLAPIVEGKADAVFGSRFAGTPRRVLFFWHGLANKVLTLMSNMANDLNLTDMETGYKMVRSDILKNLRLSAETFTLEPELACRLAQWGARIYEVPISYVGRTYDEGKKIRPLDGLRALGQILRCTFIDPQFTDHAGFYTLKATARSKKYNRWILDMVKPFLGRRVLEAGAGIGNLSSMLLQRERLVLADDDPMYIPILEQRFGRRNNVRIDRANLSRTGDYDRWVQENLDTVFCSNVLEHIEDDVEVLRSFHRALAPGGNCIMLVPAGKKLYTSLDKELGHFRRYAPEELADKMRAVGFEIIHVHRFSKLAATGWSFSGHVLRRKHLSVRQMNWFDRILPLAKLAEKILPTPGMSLLVVGKKADRPAQRLAA